MIWLSALNPFIGQSSGTRERKCLSPALSIIIGYGVTPNGVLNELRRKIGLF